MTNKSMTAQELREALPPVAIWMADATIRQARKALCGCTGWPDVKRADYNLPEVEMASGILFNLFATFEAAIRMALITMPREMDGIKNFKDKKYFDEFVLSLDAYLRSCTTTEEVSIREADWTLNNL